MAVQDNDLFLVQRGTTPFRETSQNVRAFVTQEITNGNITPPIASAAQLGVIRVGANLTIDADGILDAVLPNGVEFMGEWTDANSSQWVNISKAGPRGADGQPGEDGSSNFTELTATAPILVTRSNANRAADISFDLNLLNGLG